MVKAVINYFYKVYNLYINRSPIACHSLVFPPAAAGIRRRRPVCDYCRDVPISAITTGKWKVFLLNKKTFYLPYRLKARCSFFLRAPLCKILKSNNRVASKLQSPWMLLGGYIAVISRERRYTLAPLEVTGLCYSRYFFYFVFPAIYFSNSNNLHCIFDTYFLDKRRSCNLDNSVGFSALPLWRLLPPCPKKKYIYFLGGQVGRKILY